MDVEGAAACGYDFHLNLVVCQVCGVCMEERTDTKSLPCQHSFCEQCLNKSATNGQICCPLCRRQHKLDEEQCVDSITSLHQQSIVASNTVENTGIREHGSRKQNSCGGCERSEIEKYCLQCATEICKNCVVAHRNLRCTRSHRLLSLTEYQKSGQNDSASLLATHTPSFCSQHPDEELTHFCETCDVAICKECTATKHQKTKHKFRSLPEASVEVSQRLTEVVQEFTAREKALNDSMTSVLAMMVSLKEQHEMQLEKVNEHIDKTIASVTSKIEAIRQSQQSQLRSEFDNRIANLCAQLKELENLASNFTHTREFAEQLLETPNAVVKMSASKWVFSQIENLLAKGAHQLPVANDYMEFERFEYSFEELRLGEVKVSPYEVEVTPQIPRVQEEVNISIKQTEKTIATPPTDFIKATVVDPDDETNDVRITHRRDGTFSLGSLGQKEGIHKLSVSVYNTPVVGSPFHVHVIPRKGLLRQFGGLPSEQGSPFGPRGVTLTKTGDLLVCNKSDNLLQSFNLNGNANGKKIEIRNIDKPFRPRFAAVSKNGYIYFTTESRPSDAGRYKDEIIVCNQNYELAGSFGNFNVGIAIGNTDGKVYATQSNYHSVNIYKADGTFIERFGSAGTGRGQFNKPYGVCTTKDGKVLVSDKGNDRIQVFTAYGEFLQCFGSQGNNFGQFNAPEDITIDRDGNVYVCDTGNNRVQKFDSEYNYVCLFQSEENEHITPSGICVTDDVPYGKVVISDYKRGRISVFAQ